MGWLVVALLLFSLLVVSGVVWTWRRWANDPYAGLPDTPPPPPPFVRDPSLKQEYTRTVKQLFDTRSECWHVNHLTRVTMPSLVAASYSSPTRDPVPALAAAIADVQARCPADALVIGPDGERMVVGDLLKKTLGIAA